MRKHHNHQPYHAFRSRWSGHRQRNVGRCKRIAISNCVFDGTNAGIRLTASRGRGGVVEDIRVDNIVMKNIQGDAFIFDLFYDRLSKRGTGKRTYFYFPEYPVKQCYGK
ncbi:MAG: glycosyl hydrolase family 28 protein [Bacteroides cellulosilyticus]